VRVLTVEGSGEW